MLIPNKEIKFSVITLYNSINFSLFLHTVDFFTFFPVAWGDFSVIFIQTYRTYKKLSQPEPQI